MTSSAVRRGTAYGLLAAAAFGSSAPLAKRLLGDVRPQLLAGLLYLGAFLALAAVRRDRVAETRLQRADWPVLGVVTLTGGIVAPILMLLGLQRVTGVAGSLLLNLEAVFTVTIAVAFFREHLGVRSWMGAATIVTGGAVLASGAGAGGVDATGCALLAGACLCWAIDNNLTQRISDRDPFAIVKVKSAVSAIVNLSLGLLLGADLPPFGTIVAACVLGAVAYGVSIVLDAYALRAVGAARESALFATGPFFGALLAVPVLGEVLGPAEFAAAGLMVVGVSLLVSDRHAHLHRHEAVEHDHRHRHDDRHHEHVHVPAVTGWHAHSHRHDPVEHEHGHVSDSMHRHRHR